MPKVRLNLSVDDSIIAIAKKRLKGPPKKSLSQWIEEKLFAEFKPSK